MHSHSLNTCYMVCPSTILPKEFLSDQHTGDIRGSNVGEDDNVGVLGSDAV
jgi:hypothetical protein